LHDGLVIHPEHDQALKLKWPDRIIAAAGPVCHNRAQGISITVVSTTQTRAGRST